MKIGILTFHRAYNCGAMLQAWAMKRTLEKMGHVAEFPVCNHVGEMRRWVARPNPRRRGLERAASWANSLLKNAFSVPVEDVARFRYRRFRERHLPERECRPEELGEIYDLLIVGSDQVWSSLHASQWWPVFLGENWGKGGRAVVYGASYGDRLPDGPCMARLMAALERFQGVSVRENYAKDDFERAGADKGRVAVVADPTLLPAWEEYKALAAGVKVPQGRYLFMYSATQDSRALARVARAAARRLGMRAVVAPAYQYTRWGAPPGLTYGMSPERLVAYTMGAACVLSCSFHGTVLGLRAGKPTLSILEKPDGGRSRSGELLRTLHEGERLVSLETPVDEMCRLFGRGGPSAAAVAKMAELGAGSAEWLEKQLDASGPAGKP